jgi:hypothetical protein
MEPTLINKLSFLIFCGVCCLCAFVTQEEPLGDYKEIYLFLRKLVFSIYHFVGIHRCVNSCLSRAGSFLKF